MLPTSCDATPPEAAQGLAITYWLQAAPDGEPYAVAIRLQGRLRGAPAGEVGSSFDTVRSVQVTPGSGPVAVTMRVLDVAAGCWDVSATPTSEPRPGDARPSPPSGRASGETMFAPLARVQAPGVRVGAWPVLVALGAVSGVALQAVLAARLGLPRSSVLLVALMACLFGLVGAKLYYAVGHRDPGERATMWTGMSVQGFVIASVLTIVVGAFSWSIPLGAILDVTGPALLAGLAIGRLGCFFGGCCAGRPTASRWGVWSSDRRVGVRRLPVQLLEAAWAAALLIPTTTLVRPGEDAQGWVFVVAVAGYTFGRQLLFPMRSIPRATRHGRAVTMAVSGVAVVSGLVVGLW